MKLQPASKKEVKRISIGSLACLGIEIAVFFLLDQFGILTFSYRVILGGLVGTAIAVLNFTLLCLTIQIAADTADQKQMKAKFQLSYNARLIFQAAWVVIAFVAPCFHVLAAAIPLLFPNLIIFFLQSRGKLTTPSDRKNPESSDEEPEDRLDTFEA